MPEHETTVEFIARVQAYCDAATDGPLIGFQEYVHSEWFVQTTGGDIVARFGGQETSEANATLFAQSRTDLPRALKALEYVRGHYKSRLGVMLGEAFDRVLARILSGEEVDDG